MHLGNPDLLSQTWAAFRLYTGASSSGLFPGSPSRARTGGLLGRPGGPAAGRAPILLHQAAAPERRAPVHRRQPGDSDNGPASSLRAWGAAARPSPGERAPAQDFKPAYSAAQRLGRRRRLSIPAYPPHPRGTMVRAGKYLSHHYVIKLLASRLMPLPSRSRIPRQSTSRSSGKPPRTRRGRSGAGTTAGRARSGRRTSPSPAEWDALKRPDAPLQDRPRAQPRGGIKAERGRRDPWQGNAAPTPRASKGGLEPPRST